MIRNDIYALYQGKEYEVISSLENKKRTYQLRSLDSKDLKNGFLIYKRPEYVLTSKGDKFYLPPRDPNEPDIYLKDITSSEVDDVYHINTLAEYKGVTVGVEKENETQYLLFKGYDKYGSLGFDLVAKGEYEKWINKDEVANVHEVKRPIPDFFED